MTNLLQTTLPASASANAALAVLVIACAACVWLTERSASRPARPRLVVEARTPVHSYDANPDELG